MRGAQTVGLHVVLFVSIFIRARCELLILLPTSCSSRLLHALSYFKIGFAYFNALFCAIRKALLNFRSAIPALSGSVPP